MTGTIIEPIVSVAAAETSYESLRPIASCERRLSRGGLTFLALMGPTLAALLLDPRVLNGVSVWVKPLKFEASIAVYLLTMSWFVGSLPAAVRRRPFMTALVYAALILSALELSYIASQAALGVASHYNETDAFHRAMFISMGVVAVALTAISPALAAILARHRPAAWSAPFWLSVIIGLTLTFVLGAGTGFVLGANGGHWVGGVRSDAGGLPVFGWSRTGGDLRVAHFLGLHAMQVLPAVGLVLSRARSSHVGTVGIVASALAYSGIVALLFLQALRGMPFGIS
jgi:hypothetical protein